MVIFNQSIDLSGRENFNMQINILTEDGLLNFLNTKGEVQHRQLSSGGIISTFSSNKYDLSSTVKADNVHEALKGHLESIFELKYNVKN